MSKEEKLRIARQLERMHVDVIEAGFPASSDGDFEAVQAVARAIKDSTICGLARANEKDVRRCGEAVRVARSPRPAHVYRHFAHSHGNEAAHGAHASGRSGCAGDPMGERIH
jgi:isopropylmalate/homocitrate/citramalate synthase